MATGNGENKRLAILIGAAFCVIAIITGAIFAVVHFAGGEDNPDEVKSTVAISAADQELIKSNVNAFLKGAGSFGVRTENLNADNIMSVQYITAQDSNNVSTFFTTRERSYMNVRNYILEGSSLYYDANTTGKWSNAFETSKTATFELRNADIDVEPNGAYLSINGEQTLAAYVDVKITSRETVRTKTADDAGWDGSFKVREKVFENVPARLTVVKEPKSGEWKIYAINNLESQFLLSTWASPEEDAYNTQQTDFKDTGDIIKADISKLVPDGETTPSGTPAPSDGE